MNVELGLASFVTAKKLGLSPKLFLVSEVGKGGSACAMGRDVKIGW